MTRGWGSLGIVTDDGDGRDGGGRDGRDDAEQDQEDVHPDQHLESQEGQIHITA